MCRTGTLTKLHGIGTIIGPSGPPWPWTCRQDMSSSMLYAALAGHQSRPRGIVAIWSIEPPMLMWTLSQSTWAPWLLLLAIACSLSGRAAVRKSSAYSPHEVPPQEPNRQQHCNCFCTVASDSCSTRIERFAQVGKFLCSWRRRHGGELLSRSIDHWIIYMGEHYRLRIFGRDAYSILSEKHCKSCAGVSNRNGTFQNCSRQCPLYSRTMQRSDEIALNSCWPPGAGPIRIQKVSEWEKAHTRSHCTRPLRRRVNQQQLLHCKRARITTTACTICSRPSGTPIRSYNPVFWIHFNTLWFTATHLMQRSSPEGSLVHASDYTH